MPASVETEKLLDIPQLRQELSPEAIHDVASVALALMVGDYLQDRGGEFGYGDQQKLERLRAIGVFAAAIPGGGDQVIAQTYSSEGADDRRAELVALLDPQFERTAAIFSTLPQQKKFFHGMISAASEMIKGPREIPEAYHSFEQKWNIVNTIFQASQLSGIDGKDRAALVGMVRDLIEIDPNAREHEDDILSVVSLHGARNPWVSLSLVELVSDTSLDAFTDPKRPINLYSFFRNVRFDPFTVSTPGEGVLPALDRLYVLLDRLSQGEKIPVARSILMATLSLQESYDTHLREGGWKGASQQDLNAFYKLLDRQIGTLPDAMGELIQDKETFLRIVRVEGQRRWDANKQQYGEAAHPRYSEILGHADPALTYSVYESMRDEPGSVDHKTVLGFLQSLGSVNREFFYETDKVHNKPRWLVLTLVGSQFVWGENKIDGEALKIVRELIFGVDTRGFVDALFAHGVQDWLPYTGVAEDDPYVREKLQEFWQREFAGRHSGELTERLNRIVASENTGAVPSLGKQIETVAALPGADGETIRTWLKKALLPALISSKVSADMKEALGFVTDRYLGLEYQELRDILATIPADHSVQWVERRLFTVALNEHNPEWIVSSVEEGFVKGIEHASTALMLFSLKDTEGLESRVVVILCTALVGMVQRHHMDRKHPTVDRLLNAEKTLLQALVTNIKWLDLVRTQKNSKLLTNQQIGALIAAAAR